MSAERSDPHRLLDGRVRRRRLARHRHKRGVEIAIDDKKDVLGHKIELIGEDDLCSAEGGQTAAQKLRLTPRWWLLSAPTAPARRGRPSRLCAALTFP